MAGIVPASFFFEPFGSSPIFDGALDYCDHLFGVVGFLEDVVPSELYYVISSSSKAIF